MKLKKIALLNLLMAVAAVPALTSYDDDEPKGGEIVPPGEEEVSPPEEEEETILKQSDIVGAWDAEGYRWDTYYVYAPMIFYCKPGKAYIPND